MATKIKIEQPPSLKIDKVLYGRYESWPMPPHVRRERRIVWNLMLHLERAGWRVASVHDGENEFKLAKTGDKKTAMELIFNLDDARVIFHKERDDRPNATTYTAERFVHLILGNDLDCISDYTSDLSDWSVAMEKFDPELLA